MVALDAYNSRRLRTSQSGSWRLPPIYGQKQKTKTNIDATTFCSAECMGCHPPWPSLASVYMPSVWPPSGVTSGVTPGRPSTNQGRPSSLCLTLSVSLSVSLSLALSPSLSPGQRGP